MKRSAILLMPFILLCGCGSFSSTSARLTKASRVSPKSIPSPCGVATLEDFGAVGDGSTPDSGAMDDAINALNAGTCQGIQIGAKTYLVNPTVSLQRGFIAGYGPVSVLKTTANAPIIKVMVATADTPVSVHDLSLVGNSAAFSTGSSQQGIQVGDAAVTGSGAAYGIFYNLFIYNMGGDGISYAQNPMMSGASTIAGPIFSKLVIHDCWGNGIDVQTRGEYLTISDSQVQRCWTWGVYIDAGNVEMTGTHVILNHNGVAITNGTNGAHGGIDNCTINHQGNIGLEYSGTNGERITNTALIGAETVQVDAGAVGLLISDSQIDVASYTFGAASQVELNTDMWASSYGDVVTADPTATIKAYHPILWGSSTVPSFIAPYVVP